MLIIKYANIFTWLINIKISHILQYKNSHCIIFFGLHPRRKYWHLEYFCQPQLLNKDWFALNLLFNMSGNSDLWQLWVPVIVKWKASWKWKGNCLCWRKDKQTVVFVGPSFLSLSRNKMLPKWPLPTWSCCHYLLVPNSGVGMHIVHM